MKRIEQTIAALLVACAPSISGAAAIYQLTDLGTFGGAASYAYGINDLGQVVGAAQASNGETKAFIWSNGGMTELSGLGGASYAYSINNAGLVVGSSQATSAFYHPTLWNAGVASDLGGINPGTLDPFRGDAYAINNNDLIVGHAFYHAQLWDSQGTATSFGTLQGNHAFATGINDLDKIAGYYYGTNQAGGFLIANGVTTLLDLQYVSAINNSDQIIGAMYGNPYAWNGGTYQSLQPVNFQGGSAEGINDQGQIVGYVSGGTGLSAALWDDDGFVDLNDQISPALGWHLEYASDVNELGQIVGYGTDATGNAHAFLLTPVAQSIPEPSTLLLATLALITFLRGRGPAVAAIRRRADA